MTKPTQTAPLKRFWPSKEALDALGDPVLCDHCGGFAEFEDADGYWRDCPKCRGVGCTFPDAVAYEPPEGSDDNTARGSNTPPWTLTHKENHA